MVAPAANDRMNVLRDILFMNDGGWAPQLGPIRMRCFPMVSFLVASDFKALASEARRANAAEALIG